MQRTLRNLARVLDVLGETDGAILCLRSVIKSAGLQTEYQDKINACEFLIKYANRVGNTAVAEDAKEMLREMQADAAYESVLDEPSADDERTESSEQPARRTVDPDTERLLRHGSAAMNSREWPAASNVFRQLLDRPGVPVTAELNLATAEARVGRFDSAMKHAEFVRKKLATDSDALLLYANIACICGEFSKALEVLESLPDSRTRDLFLVVAKSGLYRFDDLLETIARVRRGGYNDSYLSLRAGHAHLVLGRHREAVHEFERVIEDEGARRHGGEESSEERDEALYCKAMVLLAMQAEAPSDELLRESAVAMRAYVMSTEDAELDYQQIFPALQRLKPEQAQDYVELVLEQTRDTRFEMLRLQVLTVLGRFDECLRAIAGLGSDELPSYAARDAAVLRTLCLMRLERYEEVLSFIEAEASSVIPPGIRGNFCGGVLLALGEPLEARKALVEALAHEPEDPVVLMNLANAEHQLGERESGVDHARQALAQDSCFVQAWLLLNEMFLADGYADKAAQLRIEAATHLGFDPWEESDG